MRYIKYSIFLTLIAISLMGSGFYGPIGSGSGGGSGAATWGSITGTLSAQTDLQTALDAKAPTNNPTFTGVAGFANGTGAAPSIAQSSDPDNGLLFGTNTVGIATAGTEQWRVDASGDLIPVTDNADDIGTTTTRVKDVWASGSYNVSTTGNQKLTALSDATRIFTGAENGAQVQVRTTDTAVGGAGAFQVWDQRGYTAVFTDQYFSTDNTHDIGQTEAFGGSTFVRPRVIHAGTGFSAGANSTADGTAASSIYLEAGNKTAGTGNGGSLSIRGGTSSGGAAGGISIETSGQQRFVFGPLGNLTALGSGVVRTSATDQLGYRNIFASFDGGGSFISVGSSTNVAVPYSCTAVSWNMLGDTTSSATVNVWKDTYANYPPTVADSIVGSEKPTITSSNKNEDTSLTSFTTAITAGDIVTFNLDTNSGFSKLQVGIRCRVTNN